MNEKRGKSVNKVGIEILEMVKEMEQVFISKIYTLELQKKISQKHLQNLDKSVLAQLFEILTHRNLEVLVS
jgi:myo-inositol-1-phosphate synthase